MNAGFKEKFVVKMDSDIKKKRRLHRRRGGCFHVRRSSVKSYDTKFHVVLLLIEEDGERFVFL